MGFLDGLLSPAITQAANARGAWNAGRKQADDDALKQALQLVTLRRQGDQDQMARALHGAQMRHYDAQTNALENPSEKVEYKSDAAGNLIALPKAIRPQQQQTNPVVAAPSQSPDAATNGAGGTPLVDHNPGLPVLPPQPQDSTKPAPFGISTGIKTAVKQPAAPKIDPLSQQGLAADSTRAANRATIAQQHPKPGAPDRVLVQTMGPGGTPVYTPRSQAAGMTAPTRQPAVGNEQNKLTGARATAAIAEMNNAHPSMADYEDKLRAGTANISGLSQYLNQVGNDFVKNENPAKQSAALAILNKSNPELARYIRRGLSFAEGESQISARPSDFRTKMAAFLSTAAVGASPEMIDDIRTRRESILKPLNVAYPGLQGQPGQGSAGNDPGGDIDLRGPQRSHASPPRQSGGLTAAQKQRAAADPTYAAFLRAKGQIP